MKLLPFKRGTHKYQPGEAPRHIAIIRDGNGRWAKRRGLPRSAGHSAGAEALRRLASYGREIGVEYLTVYAFSTENWKRPKEEVDALMELLNKYLLEAIEKIEAEQVRVRFFGDISVFSPEIQARIAETNALSDRVQGCQTNVCLNYGGRDEIVRAARKWAERVKAGETGELTEEGFSDLLWSAGIPDPELLIRPGGEKRLSNFLPWQTTYSELVFSNTLWPDFGPKQLDEAIAEYKRRVRRFGGL